MDTHFDWSDEAFLRDFSNLEFPPALFNHEAHLRLAFIHLRRDGLEKSVVVFPQLLKAFVQSQGAMEKYHETLTVAGLFILDHFMKKNSGSDFRGLIENFPHLKDHFRELVAAHYSDKKLQHPSAKSAYQIPDLLPFAE